MFFSKRKFKIVLTKSLLVLGLSMFVLTSSSFLDTHISTVEAQSSTYLKVSGTARVALEKVAQVIHLEVKMKNVTKGKDLGKVFVDVSCSNEESKFGSAVENCFVQNFEAWKGVGQNDIFTNDILEITVTDTNHKTFETKQIAYTGSRDTTNTSRYTMTLDVGNFVLKMYAGDVFQAARSLWNGDIDYADKANYIKWMTFPFKANYPTSDPDNWRYFVRDGDDQIAYERWMQNIKDMKPGQVYTEAQVKAALPSAQKGNWFTTMMLSVLGLLASLVATLISIILKFIIILLSQVDAGYKNPIIVETWKEIRDLLNLVFIAAIFIMALSNILGFDKDNYGIKKNLPKMILMVIAVNFSYIFVGLVLDAANVIEATIYSFADMGPHGSGFQNTSCNAAFWTESGSLPCRLMIIFRTQNLDAVGPYISGNLSAGGIGSTDMVIAAFGMLLLMIGSFFAFIGIALIFLVRTIALWFLTITSPIFFVGQAFSLLKQYADKWKEQFFKYAFMHIKLAFFLSIGVRLTERFAISSQGGTKYYSVNPDENFIPGVVSIGGQNDPITMNAVLAMLFMFACIWMGVFSSMKSDIGAIDGIAEKFSGAGKSTMKFLGKKSTLNWGQDFGIPGGGVAKKIGLPRGLTLKDLYAGGKKYLDQRKANLDATHDLRSGGVAAKLTGAAELAGRGAKRIPGIGGFIQEQAIGVHEGSTVTLKRALLQKEKSVAAERIGDVGTDQIASKKMLDNAIAAGKRGEAMHLIEQLGKNEDNAEMMFGALMTLVESGQIDMTEAIRTAQQFKGFHSGLLAVEEIAQLSKNENGDYDIGKFRDFMKANKVSNKDISDPAKQREALSNLFVNGAFKMTIKTDSELAQEAAEKHISKKNYIASLTKRVADMMLVKDDHSKRDFDQQDGETWDNIVTGADDLKIQRALRRGHDGRLVIRTNKLARGLVALQKIRDLDMSTPGSAAYKFAESLGYTKKALDREKADADHKLDLILRNLTPEDLQAVRDEIARGDSSYIGKALYKHEMEASSTNGVNEALSRFSRVEAAGGGGVLSEQLDDEVKRKRRVP